MMIVHNKVKHFLLSATIVVISGLTKTTIGYAGTLPVTCSPCDVGGTKVNFNDSGAALPTVEGNTLTVNQQTNRAIYNWSSFNIGADGVVVFKQPDASAIALNRIHDLNPSNISGSLQSNGQLYLLNQNGFLFGRTARVNTGGLLASSLNMTDDIFNNGLLSATKNLSPALQSANNLASVVVEKGARIVTNSNGQRILLAASSVTNDGEITASGGQVILAAGDSVYLNASDDPALRGLLVEVGGGGTVVNTGSVTAERGNITAVGLAVNQNGRMSATTSVSENGSIRLLARDRATVKKEEGQSLYTLIPGRGGSLTLGNSSITRIDAESSDRTTALDEQKQSPSMLDFAGKTVQFASGSQVIAGGGKLNVFAASNQDPSANPNNNVITDNEARIRVDSGASIDLSGNKETASVTRNLVSVELRGNELADSPQQRDGVLRGKTVVVDARVGTPLANVDGAINLIGRTVLERTTQGGSVTFDSAGDVVVAGDATVDVSGGAVNYEGGFMGTTQLIKADRSTVDIGQASSDANYLGLVNSQYKLVSDRWGVIKYFDNPAFGSYENGYVQGADAGTIQIKGNALALDGNFIGFATNGSHQRDPSLMAKGGQFIIGVNTDLSKALSFRAPEIQLVSHVVPRVSNINTQLTEGAPLQLSTDFIKNGFSRVQLSSEKEITVQSNTPINLQAGSSLVLSAPKIEINSDITTNSGQVSLNAITSQLFPISSDNGLKIADGTKVNVSGQWINDSLVPLDTQPTESLFTKGGSISLQQSANDGIFDIGSNVSLLANGGAWLKRNGSVAGGAGGTISIQSTNNNVADLNQTLQVGNDFKVQSYGVEGAAGGVFILRVPRLEIVDDYQWLKPQRIQSNTKSSALQVGSSLFSDYGFSSFNLRADSHALESDDSKATLKIAPNTPINLESLTLRINADAGYYSSGTALNNLSTLSELPAYVLRPSSLKLQATTDLGVADQYGGILMADGSQITAPTDSTIEMTSMGNLTVAGEINVPSGAVNLSVIKPVVERDRKEFVDRQLTLQSSSVIDVSGGAILKPSDIGLRQGVLSDGGTINIRADIGSVNVEKNSLIDISGTQADLDQQVYGANGYIKQTLTTVGGALSLQGAESITMSGDLRAQGGSNRVAENTGGTLNVTLTRNIDGLKPEDFCAGVSSSSCNSEDSRVIQIINGISGAPKPGIANLDTGLIKNSGIANLSLSADKQIRIGDGVDLTVKQSLLLNSPELAVQKDGQAKLSAERMIVGPKVSLSSRPVANQQEGELTLSADQIEVTGSLALETGKTTLRSPGAIFLEGYSLNKEAPGGAINTLGDLTLEASQISPTTGSNFTINASGMNSTVQINQIGSVPELPMSVAGALDINASNIIQAGTIMAPFGSISLDASNALELRDKSVTSVSGHGGVLPFGRVDNGTSWVWSANPEDPEAKPVENVPERKITLTGATAKLSSGALLDVSGGGDLLAYQFTPGTGGKTDALAGKANGLYAIIPRLKDKAVPYDPMMWAGSDIAPGESIYLAGGSEVPEGMYQLMPARYALLPGAYLVSAAVGIVNIQPGVTATTTDGGEVIAAYRNFGSSPNDAAQFKGWVVRPGSYAHKLAQYDDQLASKFFVGHSADTSEHAKLTQDAGTLSVAVQRSLEALASVKGQAVEKGLNATVEIQAPVIEIGNNLERVATSGKSFLSNEVVNSWSVGSLLLGGQRNSKGEVIVGADSVTVGNGTELVADEVVLVANQEINLEGDAKLASTSGQHSGVTVDASKFSTPDVLKLVGDNSDRAAVLAVSDLNYIVTEREKAPSKVGGALINIDSKGVVATRGSLSIDSSGEVLLSNNLQAEHASWDLGASKITFGNLDVNQDGLTITNPIIEELQAARNITIKSASDIVVNQPLVLGTGTDGGIDKINIKATSINNMAGNNVSTFTANKILLNGNSESSKELSKSEGSVRIKANEIILNQGQLGFSGFSNVDLDSNGLIIGQGNGGVSTAGDMNITAGGITVGSGAHTHVDVSKGELKLMSSATSIPSKDALTVGGTLEVTGKDIVHEARIVMPSGVVSMSAANSLTLKGNAMIDVAGINPQLSASGSNGGSINLYSQGSLASSSGTKLDVSAGNEAQAGELSIKASGLVSMNGNIQGAAESNELGGAFTLQAGTISNFSALSQQVNAGGFKGQQHYRINSGDLVVDQGHTLAAKSIDLTADNGGVSVYGGLVSHSQQQRSEIVINAKNNVVIGESAILDASAENPISQRSGSIQLATTEGHIQMASTAQVKSSGKGHSGELIVRAPTNENDFNVDSLPYDLSQVDTVILEPMKSFVFFSSAPGLQEFNIIHDNLSDYISGSKIGILNRLSLSSMSSVKVRPYADITNKSDEAKIMDLSLPAVKYNDASSTWQFDGQPAVVSIRATGNLTVTGNQSDGFVDNETNIDILDRDTVALKFVAGADLSSSSHQATALVDKDLILGDNVLVRTGTGGINLTASRDIIFGNKASVYTAGVKGFATSGSSVYADKGGSIKLIAGHDVLGNVVKQEVNGWQTHGEYEITPVTKGVFWGVDYNNFEWNLGALGGGDVNVNAGGNVKDLSAAVADSVSYDKDSNARVSLGGGNLKIRSGEDIQSGYFYVGKGVGDLRAFGELGVSGNRKDYANNNLGTLLISGDTSYRISSTGNLLLGGVLHNPLLIYTRPDEGPEKLSPDHAFNRYSQQSFINLQSSGGDLIFDINDYERIAAFGNFDNNELLAKDIYPSSATANSFGRDILLKSSLTMMPSKLGNLQLYASRDISMEYLTSANEISHTILNMSDVQRGVRGETSISESNGALVELQNSSGEILHANDSRPAHISAGRDLLALTLNLPKASEIKAGRDVIDLSLKGQQAGLATNTLISAGRDVLMTDNAGTREISVGGEGVVQVLAGRDVNLGFSRGVFSTGNLLNGNLPSDMGANILVIAGLAPGVGINTTGSNLDKDFVSTVVDPSETFRKQLVDYMAKEMGNNNLDFVAAVSAYRSLSLQQQLPFAVKVLFGELVKSGRETNVDPSLTFKSGYAALESLFPASQSVNNPYQGDIVLPFSRIYTLNGGGIAVLAPGGKVDVGLANIPANLARKIGERSPSELGIVAQQAGDVKIMADEDVLVNTSRVFTLGGGDIAIWSSKGNIDAGKGAKSAISAPPPTLIVKDDGTVSINFASAVAGSGIRTISTGRDIAPGDVDLIAPAGFVNAGDAGIGSSGNLNIAAQSVVGLDNIQVGGASTGVPPETGGLGASLSGVTSSASSSTSAASNAVSDSSASERSPSVMADAALSWLEVFVIGLGEESCKQDDLECLKRQVAN